MALFATAMVQATSLYDLAPVFANQICESEGGDRTLSFEVWQFLKEAEAIGQKVAEFVGLEPDELAAAAANPAAFIQAIEENH